MTEDEFLDEIQERYGPLELDGKVIFTPRLFAEILVMAGVLEPEPTQQDREESSDGND